MLSRLTLVSFLFLAQTGPLLAGSAEPTGDAESGATAFTQFCARCHRTATRVATDLDGTSTDALAALDTFLAGHHASDADLRADIIAFLASR